MQISVLLAEQIAELFLMILMGYVIVKLGLVTDDDSKILSKIVLYIVIPCVMINAFQIDYTPDKVQGMFLALVTSIVLQVLLLIAVWIMGKIFHLNEVEVASIYYSNCTDCGLCTGGRVGRIRVCIHGCAVDFYVDTWKIYYQFRGWD